MTPENYEAAIKEFLEWVSAPFDDSGQSNSILNLNDDTPGRIRDQVKITLYVILAKHGIEIEGDGE